MATATYSSLTLMTAKVKATRSHRHGSFLTTLFFCLVVLNVVVVVGVGAFVPLALGPTVRTTNSRIGCSSSSLPSSPTSLTPDEEDEISKLIGKRNQIKKKKREQDEATAATAVVNQQQQELLLEPTLVDLDLDKLPEFKIERPIRRASSSSSSSSSSSGDNESDDDSSSTSTSRSKKKKKKKKKEEASPIVDFKADYDDENDLLHIPNRLGITTKSWGDVRQNFVPTPGIKLTKSMIKAGQFVPGDLQTAYTKLLERGVTFMETSPTYGAASRKDNLSALDILQLCLQEQSNNAAAAADNTDGGGGGGAGFGLPEAMICNSLGSASAWSKLLPSRLTQSLYDAVERLGTSSVELFVVPKSFLYPTSQLVKVLVTAVESGCCNNVGVQGVTRAASLRKIVQQLQERDVTLVSNAFEYSLTNTKLEYMIQVCKDLNIIPLIINPLDSGLASGVYTATNPSGGQAGGGTASSASPSIAVSASNKKFTFAQLEKLQPLHSVQETVAERVRTRVIREMQSLQDRVKGSGKKSYGPPPKINTDITTTQVAINYVIAKGGVPLVEVNTPRQADEVLGSLGWTLNDEEVDMLDAAAALCNLSRK